MNCIENALYKMGMVGLPYSLLQHKDGVVVARVYNGENRYVIKCFEKESFCREIANYQMLCDIGVPTLTVLQATDTALLLEDITAGEVYRLGVPGDLEDREVAVLIARWYKALHRQGQAYVREKGAALYDESMYFTLENMHAIKHKTGTESLPVWAYLEKHFAAIERQLSRVQKTLTYNDFYYTNLAVEKNRSSALLFDYNLLGKGYVYADIRNVCSSLRAEAGAAFLEAYGAFDKTEIALDDVVSVITTLYFACQRASFPSWAQAAIDTLQTNYMQKIDALFNQI